MMALKALMLTMLGYDQARPMVATAQSAKRRFDEARRGAEEITNEPERAAFRVAAGEAATKPKQSNGGAARDVD